MLVLVFVGLPHSRVHQTEYFQEGKRTDKGRAREPKRVKGADTSSGERLWQHWPVQT